MVLAVFALCGASCKATKKCYMVIYVTVLLVLIIGQLGVVGIMLVRQSDVHNFLEERWNNDLSDSQREQIMITLQCGLYNDTEVDLDFDLSFDGLKSGKGMDLDIDVSGDVTSDGVE